MVTILNKRAASVVTAASERVGAVAGYTLRCAVRMRIAWFFLAGAVALVVLPLGLRDFDFGGMESKFVVDFGFGAIGALVSLVAVLATAHLYFDDLESGTTASALTRRLSRAEYVGGKLLGVMLLLAAGVAGLVTILWVIATTRTAGGEHGIDRVSTFAQAAVLFWLKGALVAAMTLVISGYAGTSLFATGAGLLVAIAGHLRPFTQAEGWFAWLRLWPNLSLFDVENLLLGNERILAPDWLRLLSYWAIFMSGLGGIAVYVFRQREH